MDKKRSRLRSVPPAVSNEAHHHTLFQSNERETWLQRGDLVEVEVEGDHNRGLPMVRGVNKRKRDPRGIGRRFHQKLDYHGQEVGSVSVFVDSGNARASSDDMMKPSGERHRSNNNTYSYSNITARETATTAVNTYVIIPEIMPQDQAVMKHLDKRRESSRPRVKPSKFREGFLLGTAKPRGGGGGDQKGAATEDVTSSLEIVLPMDVQNTTAVDSGKASSSQASESESSLDKPSVATFAGKNKFKFTYKSGAARATELLTSAAESSLSSKKGFDDHGLKAALAQVVKRVMQIKSAEPFNEPVDPVALEIPDYLDVIKEPMDLGTIRELLEGGKKYKTAKDVYKDVQLVWANCRKYNQEGDPIMDILKIAEHCFNKHWNAAGLQNFVSGAKSQRPLVQKASSKLELRDNLVSAVEQLDTAETKRKKSKDLNLLAKLNLPKIVHFDTSNLKAKARRSASVEQVMAESKAREDKLDVEDKEDIKEDSNSSQAGTDDEVAEEDEIPLKAADKGLQTAKEIEETSSAGQGVRQESNALKGSETEQAEGQTLVIQRVKLRLQDKDSSSRGSPSHKRRTFG